jgi:CDP-diacylglycerol---glycerol-3-phosphate 3-phosphatidyltransferase
MSTMTTPTRSQVFSLPNQLTAGRVALAVVLFVLITAESWSWCLVVFALAAVTDWLDGYVARLNKQTSSLGRSFDPLADKVLICGAYIFLLNLGAPRSGLTPWMVTLVVARELIVTSLRTYLETFGSNFGADWLGKLKMGLQCAAIIAIFVVLQNEETKWLAEWSRYVNWVRDALIYAMLLATLLSGLQYLWRAALLIRTDVP